MIDVTCEISAHELDGRATRVGEGTKLRLLSHRSRADLVVLEVPFGEGETRRFSLSAADVEAATRNATRCARHGQGA